ncbi:MAG: hypothetical protein Ct9H90mP24_5320 [Methanobacteriota archaeon]|nr:MAG: hypothetical protein Ct9H90mP24_5320 [Euryarchaeota archaeon]
MKVDDSDNTIGKKIRIHRKSRPAYMLILGDDEMKGSLSQSEAGTAIRRMAFPLSSSFRISSQRFPTEPRTYP